MESLLIILVATISVAGIVTAVALKYRSIIRESKNIERGLKTVPIRIHLPPSSSDLESGGRDSRDVVQERISQAEVLYNLIASTAKKGFKSKLHGQRHVAFELVSKGGKVYYYAAVPMVLVPVVEQAILTSYPSARLEHAEELNIFNPVGKISGTIGGELSLKKDYAYPIATVKDIKRDTMEAILNALTKLGPEDGAGIQILIRPAKSGWDKRVKSEASSKRKGKDKKSGGFSLKDIAMALVKPPEVQDSKPEDKQLSSTEQQVVESIEDKARYPAYETMIRVVASSNTAQSSQNVLNNIIAAFALFDNQSMNGFKYNPAKDIENFISAFILRIFPQNINKNILNSVELASLFHLPDSKSTPSSQVQRLASKEVDGPSNMPEDGLLLGQNSFRGLKKEVRLSPRDRRRHVYMVGQTGTGKSVILENLAYQDMINGGGFAFIDPHGDAVDYLMSVVPKERVEDVIYFNPADMDFPMGLNLFEFDTPDQKDFLIQEAINMLYKLYDPGHTGIIGPRYEHWFRNIALTLMADPKGATFIDIPTLLNNYKNKAYLDEALSHVTDPAVIDFWKGEMAQTSDYHLSEVLGWFVSKFGAFRNNAMMRNIIGQVDSSLDIRKAMDEGKIIFVNLSKGKLGELNSKLLGMIFITKFQTAAMSRANIDESQRRDFSLFVDEFQNFSTDSFESILSEARKYRLNLIVANQYISQLTEGIRDAVFGNVGTVISLRSSAGDADFLAKQFEPVFDASDLTKIPNYHAIVKLMVGGVPSQPFSMQTLPPMGNPNPQLSNLLSQLSAAKYAKPRPQVEKEIFARFDVKQPEPKRPSVQSRAASAGKSGSGSSSFLDEWLAKRKAQLKNKPSPDTAVPTSDDSTKKKADTATESKDYPPSQNSVPNSNTAQTSSVAQPQSFISKPNQAPQVQQPDTTSSPQDGATNKLANDQDNSRSIQNSQDNIQQSPQQNQPVQQTQQSTNDIKSTQQPQPKSEESLPTNKSDSVDNKPLENNPTKESDNSLEPGEIYIDEQGNIHQG